MPITIPGETYNVLFHVVNDNLISYDVLLGRNFFSQVQVIISDGKIIVNKLKKEINEENFVFNISVASNDFDIDTDIPDLSNFVKNLITNYNPVPEKFTDVKLRLCMLDDEPIVSRPRRLSVLEARVVDTQIDEWLRGGIIKPSVSDYSSPIVLVKKKDNSTRLCIDYRRINKKIVKDRFPMPLIDDQLDKLRGSRIFTTLDLKNGFFHVAVAEESTNYTAFVTPTGHYEFVKAPFGLCNSPAVFVKFINNVFQDFISAGVVMLYMDDIVIPAQDEIEAKSRLSLVIKRCQEYGLQINWKKCVFFKRKVEYLGNVVEYNSVRPSPAKTAAVAKFPQPTTKKNIQSFLGLTGYFRKFIKDYAAISKPLSDLLRKDATFKSNEEQKTAFILLKERLSSAPVLKIF